VIENRESAAAISGDGVRLSRARHPRPPTIDASQDVSSWLRFNIDGIACRNSVNLSGDNRGQKTCQDQVDR